MEEKKSSIVGKVPDSSATKTAKRLTSQEPECKKATPRAKNEERPEPQKTVSKKPPTPQAE